MLCFFSTAVLWYVHHSCLILRLIKKYFSLTEFTSHVYYYLSQGVYIPRLSPVSLALDCLPELFSLLFSPLSLPTHLLSLLPPSRPPQWSFADILCHNPDTALPQSLLGFSSLLPLGTDCLFWTMPILVFISPLFRESRHCW